MAVAMAKPMMALQADGLGQAEKKLAAFERSLQLMGGYSLSVTSSSAVIGFVLRGTRAHVIRPRFARALRVPGYGVFASVRHPGTRPNPFIQEAFVAKRLELERRAAAEMDREFDHANPDAGRQALQLMANVLQGEIQKRVPRRRGDLARTIETRVGRG